MIYAEVFTDFRRVSFHLAEKSAIRPRGFGTVLSSGIHFSR